MRFLVILCALLAANSSLGRAADRSDPGEPANHPALESSDDLPMAVLSLGMKGKAEISSKVRDATSLSYRLAKSKIPSYAPIVLAHSGVGISARLHLRSVKLQV